SPLAPASARIILTDLSSSFGASGRRALQIRVQLDGNEPYSEVFRAVVRIPSRGRCHEPGLDAADCQRASSICPALTLAARRCWDGATCREPAAFSDGRCCCLDG